MPTNIRLNSVRFNIPAFVLGVSHHKFGVWTQGCSLNKCAGCMSAHTWSDNDGYTSTIEDLIDLAKKQPITPTGLVVSGGEPTDQMEAILELIRQFKITFPQSEVIVYSGRPWATLRKRYDALLAAQIDVLVAEPYVDQFPRLPMAGSSNQKLVLISEYAKSVYADFSQWPSTNRIMVYPSMEDGVMTIIGVPNIDLNTIFRG